MGAPTITGQTVINEMSSTTGLSVGGSGLITIFTSGGRVSVSEGNGSAGVETFFRCPISSPIDFSGDRLLAFGLRLQSTSGIETIDNGGVRVRLYSNAGFTEYADWAIAGSGFANTQSITTQVVPVILDPRDTTLRFSATAGFSTSTIQRFELRFKRAGGGSQTYQIGQLSYFSALALVDGVGSPGSFENFAAYVLGNIQALPFQKLGTGQYTTNFPVRIGNNSTQTAFSDNFSSALFATPSTLASNPRLNLYTTNSIGLSVQAAASDSVSLNISTTNQQASGYFQSSGSGTINFLGGGIVSARNTTLTSGTFALTFNGCRRLFLNGAQIAGSVVESTTDTHAIEISALANTKINNCTIRNNAIGVLFNGVTGSTTLTNVTFSGNTTDIRATNLGGGTLTIAIAGGTNPTTSTDGSGTLNIVAPTVTVTLTGLATGTEVRVYNAGTSTEVAGIEATASSTFSFTGTSGASYDIEILSLLYKNQFIAGFIFPDASTSVPISQQLDRDYINP